MTNSSGLTDVQDITVSVTDESAVLSLALETTTISENGGLATGTLTRSGDTSGALTAALTSDDTSVVTLPASVTFADGETEANFTVTAVDGLDLDGDQLATITATAGLVNATTNVTVTDDVTAVTDDPNFVVASVNDWGSGFQVTYDYTVTEDSILDGDLFAWIIDSGYSGPGTLVNAFATNFNGPTSTTPTFAVTNANAGFQPELQPGDTFSVTVQVLSLIHI